MDAVTGTTERFLEARLAAQRSALWIQLAALAVAVGCIALAARLQSPINVQRKDLQLVLHSDIYRDLPPKYAWTTAAGGTFRGVAAHILWMRAEQLKQEGKYYESHQLAKWICTLQPRFPQVWRFQAWNMAYNISVATHTPQERWQWVYNGIRLLRDEGIPNNPRAVPLYHELAWIWNHKVGARADNFHWYYKREWASLMDNLLGSPPRGLSREEVIDWFRPVAEAPQTLAALQEAHPDVSALLAQLDALGVNVRSTTDLEKPRHPLETEFFEPYTRYRIDRELASLRASESDNQEVFPEQPSTLETFFQQSPPAALDALLAYLRAKVLREQYKMDPVFMLELTGRLGTDEPVPIDWRTPWSQAIYWALYGTEQGRQLDRVKEFDLINTDRILLNALAMLARQGNYDFRINTKDYFDSFLAVGPDLDYVEPMHQMYLKLGPVYAGKDEDVDMTAGEMLRSGHVNNLQSAIVAFYWAGRHEEAQRYLDYLARHYKNTVTGETEELYLQGLDSFVRSQMQEMVELYHEAVYTIHAMLRSAYISLGTGQVEDYTRAVQNARLIHELYQEKQGDSPEGRQTLPKFADMQAQVLANFVTDVSYPLYWRSLVWRREQDAIKRRFYDMIFSDLKKQCERMDVDVKVAFPEPEGMDAWRERHPMPTSPEEISEELSQQP